MTAVWRSLWREPRPADPPPVGRWDWLLAGAFAAAVVVEGLARSGMPWRPVVIVLALALTPAFLWRCRQPLLACVAGFGVAGLLSLLQWVTHSPGQTLSAMVAIVVLLYSLVRWGAGREIAVGLPFVLAVVALGLVVGASGWEDIVGGVLFVLLFIALGAVVRSRADLWARRHREVRNEERLALARELHDTVAHHVSAIAVQAQAGGIVAAAQPDRAAQILAGIEAEASRTLSEMRTMVRVLREDEWDAYSPQLGVADLQALASADVTPAIEVTVADSAMRLPRPVDATLYRLAQEALTNALRHARDATRVGIEIRRVGDVVRLRVADDGRPHAGPGAEPGFGLTGMAERAALLGGSLTAGPGPHGGWVVDAALPAGGPR